MEDARLDALAKTLAHASSRRGAFVRLITGGVGGALLTALGRGPASAQDGNGRCTSRGCRCNGGVQNACGDGLVCCPDNPGLPGGPGRCLRQGRCNPPDPGCTGEGCSCHTGTLGACDDGLVCCADDSSLPGGPGRCEEESVCYANQCQATTNPCPPSCAAGAYCQGCCSGYCSDDDHCATAPCSGVGCECTTGSMQGPRCDDGLVCCQSQMGAGPVPGGPGLCATPDGCGDAGIGAAAPAATPDD